MSAIGPLFASARMPVLAGLIALLLGGCVTTMDPAGDRSFADQIAQPEPVSQRAITVGEPADQAEWRLRLSYL